MTDTNEAARQMSLRRHELRRQRGETIEPPTLEQRSKGGIKSGEVRRAKRDAKLIDTTKGAKND